MGEMRIASQDSASGDDRSRGDKGIWHWQPIITHSIPFVMGISPSQLASDSGNPLANRNPHELTQYLA